MLFNSAAGKMLLPIVFNRRVRNLMAHPKVRQQSKGRALGGLRVYRVELRGDCCWKVYQSKFHRGINTVLQKAYKGHVPGALGSVMSFTRAQC